MALGVLREGRVHEAERMLRDAIDALGADPELTAAHDRVEGERVVLGGEWSPTGLTPASAPRRAGRVLHVVGKSLPQVTSGYTVRTQGVARAQRSVGLDPIVVSRVGFPEAGHEAGSIEDVDGISHIRLEPGLPVPTRWDARLDRHVMLLEGVVDECQPALLHAHSDFENALVALAVGRTRSIPVVYEVRGFWEETWLSKSPSRTPESDRYRLRREREAESMNRADLVVTLSSTMAERVAEEGVDAERIVVVPNAVDPDRFPFAADPDRELRQQLGVGSAELVIGYVTSLVAYEGVDGLIEAVDMMVQKGLDVRAVVVGDGEERLPLERQAQRAGLQDRLVFTGGVPHATVARYYAALDVFVVPRRDDRVCRLVTPIKPFEALSVGRPLVVSGVPPLAEIVRESGAGVVY
jgi:glycosyltransferase involved in cell wall biosynthesis